MIVHHECQCNTYSKNHQLTSTSTRVTDTKLHIKMIEYMFVKAHTGWQYIRQVGNM